MATMGQFGTFPHDKTNTSNKNTQTMPKPIHHNQRRSIPRTVLVAVKHSPTCSLSLQGKSTNNRVAGQSNGNNINDNRKKKPTSRQRGNNKNSKGQTSTSRRAGSSWWRRWFSKASSPPLVVDQTSACSNISSCSDDRQDLATKSNKKKKKYPRTRTYVHHDIENGSFRYFR